MLKYLELKTKNNTVSVNNIIVDCKNKDYNFDYLTSAIKSQYYSFYLITRSSGKS